jgi:hypothetical protein
MSGTTDRDKFINELYSVIDELYSIKPYSPEGYFYEPLLVFETNLASLARFYAHLLKNNERVFEQANNFIDAVGHNTYEAEPIQKDIELFEEFVSATIISQLFAIFENLLDGIAKDLSAQSGNPLCLDEKKMPYINRYIEYLQDPCGLKIKLDKNDWKTLDVYRAVRNKYIHYLGRDLPESLAKQIDEYLRGQVSNGKKVDTEFVTGGFRLVSNLAKKIELAIIEKEGWGHQ